jgi:hypothetical protein
MRHELPVQLGHRVLVVDVLLASAVAEHHVLALQRGGAPHRAAERGADPVGGEARVPHAAVGQRLPGRDDRELAGPVEAAGLLRTEPGRHRVEVDLGRDPRTERRRVVQGDRAGGGSPRGEQFPVFLDAGSAWSDDAHARDGDPAHSLTSFG